MRNERADSGADDGSRGSGYCASACSRDAGTDLGVVTAGEAGADTKARAKSDQCADRRAFASSPGSRAVALYLDDVFFPGGHRPGRYLVGRPRSECAGDWSCFQGQADVIARLELCEGLPVVAILGV